MNVTVRLFASLAETIGTKRVTVTLGGPSTVRGLVAHLVGLHPGLKPLLRGAAYAVNGEMAGTNATLRNGDEVSLLPPVSGGRHA